MPSKNATMLAEKVFAIPELLENILLKTVNVNLQDLGTRGPIVSLFQLQRVSKAFNDTIQGSKKLQRYMFVVPTDIDHSHHESLQALEHLDRVGPTRWLLLEELELQEYLGTYDVTVMMSIGADTDWFFDNQLEGLDGALEKFRMAGGTRPEASWRRMKVCWFASGLPVSVGLKVKMTLGGGESVLKHITWTFGGEATLGDVFDKWLRVFMVLGEEKTNLEERVAAQRRRDLAYLESRMAKVQDAAK